MIKQLQIGLKLLILCFLANIAYSQNKKIATPINYKNDRANLQALVIKVLKWHDKDKNLDFEPLLKNPNDSLYLGLNWHSHKKRVKELEKTNFFSKDFLDNYEKIAFHLDKELKKNKIKYKVGYLPPYGNGANEWCECQDLPSDDWKSIKIVQLKIIDNSAIFKWTWGDNLSYIVKAKKENKIWKISELEKFNIRNFTW